MMIGSEYDNYRSILVDESSRPATQWTFKSNPDYQKILEHVTQEQGLGYLAQLESSPQWSSSLRNIIADTAFMNDSVGKPVKSNFDKLGINCSPTNLRYAWQAFNLLVHISKLGLKNVQIIEIGGGYGGLALFVNRLSSKLYRDGFRYIVVDVPEAGVIQRKYSRELEVPFYTVNCANKDEINILLQICKYQENFLVSCYGFSELSESIRSYYQETIIPMCLHGFLVWNMIPVYAFNSAELTIKDELPLTGYGNKVVIF